MAISRYSNMVVLDPIKDMKRVAVFKKVVFLGVVLTVLGIWFIFDGWPWPSEARIERRLQEVIDICAYQEDTKACKDIQKKYNMTFRYCRSVTDSYLYEQKYGKDFWQKGISTPLYAMAWEGESDTPPDSYFTMNGKTERMLNVYYCQSHP